MTASNCGRDRRSFTFTVVCSFSMQYTFSEDEVQPDTGGGDGDFEPTDDALLRLEKNIEQELEGIWGGIEDVDASADSESLTAVE